MIRVLLAHSSRLVCSSLQYALRNEDNIYVVGCATTGEEFRFLLPHCNVILLGTELEDKNALNLIGEARASYPNIKVLLFGVEEKEEECLPYIVSGATGYILQNESVEDIKQKLQAAYEDKAIISPSFAAVVMNRLTQLAHSEIPYTNVENGKTLMCELTIREREILQLVSAGHTNSEIANQLFLACGTVKNHVHKILKKLRVNNRHEAAVIFQMH